MSQSPAPIEAGATNLPLLVGLNKAAWIVGISPRKMWSLAAAGHIRTVRLPDVRRVLFDVRDIERLIADAKGGGH